MIFGKSKSELPDAVRRAARPRHPPAVPSATGTSSSATPIETDPPEGFEVVVVGLGCFWGEEKTFWEVPGVWSTSVGYAGGITPNPTYEEVCTGRTGHAEVVRIIFDPAKVSFQQLLQVFWENHDPTQGMRQGNDRGIAVPLDHPHHDARAAEAGRGVARPLPGEDDRRRLRPDHDDDPAARASTTTPRTTTSSTSSRTRSATARSTRPGSSTTRGRRGGPPSGRSRPTGWRRRRRSSRRRSCRCRPAPRPRPCRPRRRGGGSCP